MSGPSQANDDEFMESIKSSSCAGSNFIQAERFHIWMNHEPHLMSYSFKNVLRTRSSTFSWLKTSAYTNEADIECVRLNYLVADRVCCKTSPQLHYKSMLVPKSSICPPKDVDSACRYPAEFTPTVHINHPDGGVLIARSPPDLPNYVATVSNAGNVYAFVDSPDAQTEKLTLIKGVCKSPALHWVKRSDAEVWLVTTNKNDGLTVFDIQQNRTNSRFTINPSVANGHKDCIKSITSNKNNNVVAITQSGRIKVFDMVQQSQVLSMKSSSLLESVACHPAYEHIIVTGDVDQMVKVWDTRIQKSLPSERLTNGVPKRICFSPHRKELMAIGTDKGQIMLALFGKYLLNEKQDNFNSDTIPGAVFMHSGHTGAAVEDISFHPTIMGMIGSTDSHNSVLLWKPRKPIEY